ncbi:MAG: hypothetical protein HY272_06860 [Gammaproteobacteria bacterium]|nr:hypothetical protein [Gammaproteobacteria bacterium]
MKHTNEVVKIQNVDGYARLGDLLLGILLIASVFMVADGHLGWLSLLPIAAVYPMFVAITGYSPHRALANGIMHYVEGFDVKHEKPEDEHYRLVMH